MKRLFLVILLCLPLLSFAHGGNAGGHGGNGGGHGGHGGSPGTSHGGQGGHGGNGGGNSGHGGKGSHGHSPSPSSASHGPNSSSVVSSGNVKDKHGKVIRHPIRDGYKRKVKVAQ